MAKMFVHVAQKATIQDWAQYDNMIVFVKDTNEIYTHGQFYGLPAATAEKITNLDTAVKALQEAIVTKVSGVTAGDKVLAITDGDNPTIGATISIDYIQADRKIYLKGKGDTILGSVDTTDFIKDGMLDSTSFNEETKILTLTFNTDAGKEAIPVDLSSLVDSYNGANVKLVAIDSTINNENYSDPVAGDSVDTAISKLIAKINMTLEEAVAGVASIGGQDGAITLKGGSTTNGDVNLKMEGKQLQAEVVGLGTAAYKSSADFATAAQGTKADQALQEIEKGTEGDYVTVTVSEKADNKQSVGVSVTVQSVATASTGAKGLAEASNVKAYVDDMFAWEEL